MATYRELVERARTLVPAASRAEITDKAAGELLYGVTLSLLLSLADYPDIGHHAAPIGVTTIPAPSDLTEGFEITAQDFLRVQSVLGIRQNARIRVRLVPLYMMYEVVTAGPAAALDRRVIRPISGGREDTHAAILSAGWQGISAVEVRYIRSVARPENLDEVFPLDVLFEQAVVFGAALEMATGRDAATQQWLAVAASQKRAELLDHLVTAGPAVTRSITEVW